MAVNIAIGGNPTTVVISFGPKALGVGPAPPPSPTGSVLSVTIHTKTIPKG